MDRESGASESGFPGVRRLFASGGFPGSIKSSRDARSTSSNGSAEQSPHPTVQPTTEHGVANLTLDSPQNQASPRRYQRPPSQTTSRSSTPTNGVPVSTTQAITAPPTAMPAPARESTSSPPPQPPTDQPSPPPTVSVSSLRSMSEPRLAKFAALLGESVVDLIALRELAWSGIPPPLRPLCWRLLLGYVPPNKERREQVLARKRQEYKELVPEYYECAAGAATGVRSPEEETALRQVAVDVPRTAPGVGFFHQPRVQKCLERILYIWGVRHPASGYVQGINDLATPFLSVFIGERMIHGEVVVGNGIEEWSLDGLSDAELLEVEADCYWCLCKLLDGIQDHYTYAQPGIQKTLFHVRELVSRIEAPVAAHFDAEGVEFMQFAFRWVNCLLLRELPFALGVRLWDTYLSEGPALKQFLIYVLSSFLLSWAPRLKTMEFQELVMFLQRVPTADWTESDIELVLSRAFMWRASFKDASSHFA